MRKALWQSPTTECNKSYTQHIHLIAAFLEANSHFCFTEEESSTHFGMFWTSWKYWAHELLCKSRRTWTSKLLLHLMSQNVRYFRQKFHYRLRGTNAGKYGHARTKKQLDLSFIYNFYLCFAYLNRPSIQHLSGNKNPTTLLNTGQSVSPKGISFSGPCFYPLNSLALNFIWNQNCFVCHFVGQVTPFQGATFSRCFQADNIQLHFRRNAHSSGGWQMYQYEGIIYTFNADPTHRSCLNRIE